MKLNLAAGAHPLEGFVNLDKQDGWRFEDGLEYPDDSVDAITESHGLMYVALERWPFVFGEFARVLKPGGIIRITEDATDDKRSERYGGFHDAITLTTFGIVGQHLESVGMPSVLHTDGETWFKDNSLRQSWHGGYPKCFFIEGIKLA